MSLWMGKLEDPHRELAGHTVRLLVVYSAIVATDYDTGEVTLIPWAGQVIDQEIVVITWPSLTGASQVVNMRGQVLFDQGPLGRVRAKKEE